MTETNTTRSGAYGIVWVVDDYTVCKSIKQRVAGLGIEAAAIRECTFYQALNVAVSKQPPFLAIQRITQKPEPHEDTTFRIYMQRASSVLYEAMGALSFSDRVVAFRRWAGQLCASLLALHQAGILHRDIKPYNCLIMPEGHAVFCDFGTATFLDRPKRPGLTTEVYCAPEALPKSETVYDTPSDIYSLGATLISALYQIVPKAKPNFHWRRLLSQYKTRLQLKETEIMILTAMVHPTVSQRPTLQKCLEVWDTKPWPPDTLKLLVRPLPVISLTPRQEERISDARIRMFRWLAQVVEYIWSCAITFVNAVQLWDDYVYRKPEESCLEDLQLVALAALTLSLKWNEDRRYDLSPLTEGMDGLSAKDVEKMEIKIFCALDFCVYRRPISAELYHMPLSLLTEHCIHTHP